MSGERAGPADVNSILFFLCLNDRGGAESSMIAVARGLHKRGLRVTLALYGAQPWLAREWGFGGAVIDLGARRTSNAVMPFLRLLLRERFATVISALPYTNMAAAIVLYAAQILTGQRPSFFPTEHGVEGLTLAENSFALRFLLRRCYACATCVIAVSERLATKWRRFLPEASVCAIYNPVVADTLPVPLPPAHAWLVDRDVPVIIAAGRLKPEKNFALLVRAFAHLTASRKAHLVILGEGEQRPGLEQMAQELGVGGAVMLPGYVSDIAAWLPYAALFVSTSNREGLGNAIIEALSFGVQVVATDCPYGPGEILQDGLYGRLVPMEDAAKLAQAMGDALDSHAAQTVDKDKLLNRARNFGIARCIDAYRMLVNAENKL